MKTNKNIDRLFQEKLKDFEVKPPENVWENIESNLKKKKPNKILPIWLRIGTAAAILMLLTFGGINYFDNSPNINDVVDINLNDKVSPILNDSNINNTILNETDSNSVITDVTKTDNSVSETLNNIEKQIKFEQKEQNSVISNVVETKKNNISNSNKRIEPSTKNLSNESIIAVSNKKESSTLNKKSVTNNDKFPIDLNKENTNSNTQIATNANQFLKKYDKQTINNNSQINTANNTTDKQNKLPKSLDNNAVVQTSSEGLKKTIINQNSIETKENLKDVKIEETVAQINEDLNELLNNDLTDDKEKEQENTKKWSVASTFAPIYYNSFNTKGSPLDLQFENSPKTGSKSVAYGMKVGYKLNDKLTLQSGVSKIDVGYKIGDVFINPSQQYEARIANVIYSNTGAILNVNAGDFLNNPVVETTSNIPIRGDLNQSFGYIEVPLELKYSLSDVSRKLGVNLVGGFSTLFLNKNEVFVSTDEFSSNLGKANNLNSINFSGNIGLDVDYKINKKIYINVAPMLKIHTKTFSSNDKNFQPYLFGVYTGLNYRF